MENHHFILKKVSSLFPSSFTSCQFRTLPDVADSSITIAKTQKIPHSENDHSSLILNKPCKKNQLFLNHHSSDAEGRKCPPVTPLSTLNPKKTEKIIRNRGMVSVNHSSSSNCSGRWFTTSSDEKTRAAADDFETDTFFSLSSNSGDSFRLKTTSRRFKKCEEMKSIDETGRCSFSSLASFDTDPSKCSRKTATSTTAAAKTTAKGGEKKSSVTCAEYEPGSDHLSTRIYYESSFRRRKTGKNRRKIRRNRSRRSFCYGSTIDESYAVEKSSSDPRSDFRASMVEMIVEKQIFGAEDLERLLLCFLSLNAASYHGIIFDVFSEICQTLFSN
ncbi:hypothetical protein DH2020_025334 [Rehmannia glutinosa]|uniref:Transcription repressor n=1 Tax=Rehmannia glutinosa TaxID=99300 RepID=A0ABR0W2S5_REHGL